MKKTLFILVALMGSCASAFAACAPPAVMHDFPGTAFNMDMATSSTGNCAGKIDADTSSQLHADLTAPVAAGTNTIGNFGTDPSSGKATPTQAFLALPATTTTQIVALSGSKVTYVTLAKVLAGGTVNVTFKYGTGSNCGTGTTTLEGPYPLTAQAGYVEGNGAGPVMIVPSAQALCVTTDASVTGGVKLVYQQF